MRDSVRKAFTSFTIAFEGSTNWMYCDVKGLVTTGIGNLIDPISVALTLPWLRNADNRPANQVEIADEWRSIKGRSELTSKGGGAYRPFTTLHLDPAGIDHVVWSRLAADESYLLDRFPRYPNWPSDSQLGLLSMAWAMGPAFHFPQFESSVIAEDFTSAAPQSHMNEAGNPGLIRRNTANLLLFQNAGRVVKHGLDRDRLYYPGVAPDSGNGAASIAKITAVGLPIVLGLYFLLGKKVGS